MNAYLNLLVDNRIKIKPLLKNIYSINQAEEAYKSLGEKPSPIVVLLNYKKFNKSENINDKKIDLKIQSREKKEVFL